MSSVLTANRGRWRCFLQRFDELNTAQNVLLGNSLRPCHLGEIVECGIIECDCELTKLLRVNVLTLWLLVCWLRPPVILHHKSKWIRVVHRIYLRSLLMILWFAQVYQDVRPGPSRRGRPHSTYSSASGLPLWYTAILDRPLSLGCHFGMTWYTSTAHWSILQLTTQWSR